MQPNVISAGDALLQPFFDCNVRTPRGWLVFQAGFPWGQHLFSSKSRRLWWTTFRLWRSTCLAAFGCLLRLRNILSLDRTHDGCTPDSRGFFLGQAPKLADGGVFLFVGSVAEGIASDSSSGTASLISGSGVPGTWDARPASLISLHQWLKLADGKAFSSVRLQGFQKAEQKQLVCLCWKAWPPFWDRAFAAMESRSS